MIDGSVYLKTGIASDTSLMWGIQKTDAPIADTLYTYPRFFT